VQVENYAYGNNYLSDMNQMDFGTF